MASKRMLWILLGIIVVLILAVGGAMVYVYQQPEAPAADPVFEEPAAVPEPEPVPVPETPVLSRPEIPVPPKPEIPTVVSPVPEAPEAPRLSHRRPVRPEIPQVRLPEIPQQPVVQMPVPVTPRPRIGAGQEQYWLLFGIYNDRRSAEEHYRLIVRAAAEHYPNYIHEIPEPYRTKVRELEIAVWEEGDTYFLQAGYSDAFETAKMGLNFLEERLQVEGVNIRLIIDTGRN